MLKLLKYLKPYVLYILLIIVLLFVQAMCELALPDYMSQIVDNGILNAAGTDYIIQVGLNMLLVTLLSSIAAIALGFLAARVAAGIGRNLREEIFRKIQSFSSTEFNKFSTASLITRTTNDVQQIQGLVVMFLRIVAFAPIMGIGAIIKVLNTNTSLTWIIALIVVVVLGIIAIGFSLVMPKFRLVQKLTDRLNLVMREELSGMLVIRAFNNEKNEEEKFDEANLDITKVNIFINRALAALMPLMNLVLNYGILLLIWFSGQQIDMGNMSAGTLMAFMQYTMQIVMSFVMIAMVTFFLSRAAISANRIVEVLDTEIMIADPLQPLKFDEQQRGVVQFNNVSFRYPGAEVDVLHNISFSSKPGEVTSFIGSTGSGKSTIINLIPRFFDVTEGSVTVSGVDVRQVKQHDLRDIIGFVPQKSTLFSGTIASNLRLGAADASIEELKKAADIAQASEFIEDKEEGFETFISQGGTNVSGGQKQRLSIARAVVKNPDIYIFDDSFSALDFKTDSELRAALEKEMEVHKSTVFIVGQRISSVMNSDQIIVLDKGEIVGIGTHKELLDNCQIYQEIAYSQLSKEELGHE